MGLFTIKTRFRVNNLILSIFLLLIPLLIGLQPYTPRFLEIIIIYTRLIIGPLLIIFFLRSRVNFNWIVILTIYLIISSLIYLPPVFDDFKLMFLNSTAAVTFFMLGKYLTKENIYNFQFRYLAYGVNVFNIISLAIYFLISVNALNVKEVYAQLDRPLDIDLTRFALGNAIELPFGMTCFLFAAIVLSKNNETFIISTFLNLILAIISQSRVVVIIATFLFLYEFLKSNLKTRTFLLIVLLALFPLIVDHFIPIINSIIDRLQGNDQQSGHNRLFYLLTVLKNFDLSGLIFGHGFTSSSVLIRDILGEYKSVESVLLQLLYDIGLVGFLILFLPVFYSNFRPLVQGQYKIALLMVYVQLMLFLPVNGYMPFAFFLFGVCSYNVSEAFMIKKMH